jgi:hypothetical protein
MPLNQNTYYTVKNNKSQHFSERPYKIVGIKTKNPRSFHFEGFGKETKFSYFFLPKPFVSSIA